MKKRKTGGSAALAGTIALVVLGGGALYMGLNRSRVPAPTPVNAAPTTTSSETENDTSGGILPKQEIQPQAPTTHGSGDMHQPIVVYTVAVTDNGEHLEKHPLSTKDVHGDSDAERAAAALNAMAASDHSPLPSGTHARSVKLVDGVATVDFNKAFQENFSGGDEGEALTLNAVLATVGQFQGVRSVQFLVEGQKIDSLGGNQSLTAPLPIPQDIAATGHSPAAVAKSEP